MITRLWQTNRVHDKMRSALEAMAVQEIEFFEREDKGGVEFNVSEQKFTLIFDLPAMPDPCSSEGLGCCDPQVMWYEAKRKLWNSALMLLDAKILAIKTGLSTWNKEFQSI